MLNATRLTPRFQVRLSARYQSCENIVVVSHVKCICLLCIKQAEMKFHDLLSMWKEGGVSSIDTQCQPRGSVSKPVIPPISFEVSY